MVIYIYVYVYRVESQQERGDALILRCSSKRQIHGHTNLHFSDVRRLRKYLRYVGAWWMLLGFEAGADRSPSTFVLIYMSEMERQVLC